MIDSTVSIKAVDILGVSVHSLTVEELHTAIADVIESSQRALVLNVNVNCMNLALAHPWLHRFLNEAPIVFCDGAGVMLGARILGHRIPERITYADWIWQLAAFVEPRHFSWFFLGARPGVAETAAARLQERFPALRIEGIQHGYFDKRPGSQENEAVVRHINRVKPNILVLGMGMPMQEKWLMENWEKLEANIALTGGAIFDYLSGELKRAPQWMTQNGMEWLGRLLIEPGRLWQRYLIGNPKFLGRVLLQRSGYLNFDNQREG